MVMVFCAVTMLLAQLMGLHFHRHVADAGSAHGTSLHLRDVGVHMHEAAAAHDEAGDRASHPDEDLEIDPLGTGIAKFFKAWVGPAFLAVAILCLLVTLPVAQLGTPRPAFHRPALFALRPPSNAPPLKLSLAR
jgi:hypothetical protein